MDVIIIMNMDAFKIDWLLTYCINYIYSIIKKNKLV